MMTTYSKRGALLYCDFVSWSLKWITQSRIERRHSVNSKLRRLRWVLSVIEISPIETISRTAQTKFRAGFTELALFWLAWGSPAYV